MRRRRGQAGGAGEAPSGQLQPAATSGSLAGGVSAAGEQTPVGVMQASGSGWG